MTVALFALSAPAISYSFEDLDLLAYYTFDNQDGMDFSDTGLDVTLFGEIGFEPGLIGSALAPNGDVSKFAAREQDDAVLDFGAGDFTIQAWVKYGDVSGEQVLIEKFIGNSGPGWSLTKIGDQSFAFATDIGGVPVVRSEPQDVAINTWHNVTIRRTSGRYELFFNNVLIASVDSDQSSSSSAPLLIGRRNDTDGRGFSTRGSLDEIAIWSRPLSDQELQRLYNNGRGRPVRIIFRDGFEPPEE